MKIVNIDFGFDWDERDHFERPAKGWLANVKVETESGEFHTLTFYDPVRLEQDLKEEVKLGKYALIEQNLIVIPEVTKQNIESAINQAAEEGYYWK